MASFSSPGGLAVPSAADAFARIPSSIGTPRDSAPPNKVKDNPSTKPQTPQSAASSPAPGRPSAKSSHAVTIAAFYGTGKLSSKLRTFRFNYLPDSLRLSLASTFKENNIQLGSAAILVYRESPPQPITFTLEVVGGLDTIQIYEDTSKTNGVGAMVGREVQESLDWGSSLFNIAKDQYHGISGQPGTQIREYARYLASLAMPSNPSLSDAMAGFPPPKCFLELGGVYKGVGAFSNVEFDFKGPWDADGLPTSMSVSFTFKPSVFYNATSRFGFGDTSSDESSAGKTNSERLDAASANADSAALGNGPNNLFNQAVMTTPSELRLEQMRSSKNAFIIQYGG